jgi:uncharacterized protein (TIGR02246 family)
MLKVLLPAALLGCCSLWAIAPQDGGAPAALSKPAVTAEEALVKEILQVYTDTFNKHDANALVEYWAEKAISVNSETGSRLVGRDAIKKGFEELFKTMPGAKLSARINHFRFLKPDLLTLEGTSTFSCSTDEPVENHFTALLVKVGEKKWVIEHATECPCAVPETAYDGLKGLDWIVGNWKDVSEGVTCESTISWNEKKTFLIRKYSVQMDAEGEAETGTQLIGWDPRSKSIRSWTFSSDGSFGEGSWSLVEKEWRIKFNHTGSDGSLLSGTQVISKIDDNTAQVEMVGLEVDGNLAPARPAVKMVRQAATPAAATKE